jgi:hypothetical protein
VVNKAIPTTATRGPNAILSNPCCSGRLNGPKFDGIFDIAGIAVNIAPTPPKTMTTTRYDHPDPSHLSAVSTKLTRSSHRCANTIATANSTLNAEAISNRSRR